MSGASTRGHRGVAARCGLLALAGALLLGCSSPPAPVEERQPPQAGSYTLTEDGRYRVRGGDTLYSIAFNFAVDWQDMARWNGIAKPYTIWPGQMLRIAPEPGRTAAQSTTTRPAGTAPESTTRPAPPQPADAAPRSGDGAATGTPPAAATVTAPPLREAVSPAAPELAPDPGPGQAPDPGPGQAPDRWLWPTDGRVLSSFTSDDPARKGINISGTEGQAVIASAAGDVVYSGNGLIGFGELIIIKHSDSMLTAYAHNRRRLVKEGDRVAAGAAIAEMGRNDQDQVMLHFEVRVNGRPVDPMRYLQPR